MNLKHIAKTHTLQHGQSDCGPACLLSIIKLYNGSAALENIRELSGTTRQGTTMLGLYQAAGQLGFDADGYEADMQALISHGEALILHTLMENRLHHYVVCYGYSEKEGFLIGDPAKGIAFMPADELAEIWPSRSCLILKPNKTFATEKAKRNIQRKYFLGILEEDYPLIAISMLLGIFVAGLGLSMAFFSQKLIDDILPSKDSNKLIAGIVLLAILLCAQVGLSALRQHLAIRQSRDFNSRINAAFFSSLLQLPKPFFENRKTGEFVSRLNDAQRVQNAIRLFANTLIVEALAVLASSAFLMAHSWRLGLICILSLLAYFCILRRHNKKILLSQSELMQSSALNESNFISSIQGIATIKTANSQDAFSRLNQAVFANYQQKAFLLGKINIKLSWQSGLAGVLFLVLILTHSSVQVFSGEIKIGELMAILAIAGSLLPSIENLALSSIPLNEAKIAFGRMFEFTSIKKENREGIKISQISKVSIQNLSFRFAGRSELFHNVSIEIEKGRLISIIGESGSGKSTLGQILQRFYDYEKGRIIIDGQHLLSDIALDAYRSLIGVIPQEVTIFNGNVIDNILLGAQDTPENVIGFIEECGFDAYFSRLPQGLATNLGEEGISLSGGQKQLIALARALYRKPHLLILDEATSAMDRNTEQFAIGLLLKAKKDCAIFFISHRLNRLKDISDAIYSLENKTISASGNHQQLLQTENFYSSYWQEQ